MMEHSAARRAALGRFAPIPMTDVELRKGFQDIARAMESPNEPITFGVDLEVILFIIRRLEIGYDFLVHTGTLTYRPEFDWNDDAD